MAIAEGRSAVAQSSTSVAENPTTVGESPTIAAEPAPTLPDYVTDPNAVLKDVKARWRYGRAPDYSKTRKVYEQTRKNNHAAGSLPYLVENLVKNWEVEASFKPDLQDWRTVDHANYTFAVNGGPPQSAAHMLKVGTYNAIIAPNDFYSPEFSDFASSHKTFKRMMPTFAWEVMDVYSGPPTVAFRWRHWGMMKNDYVGFNNKGEKITAKAHGGPIDIEGVTVAIVDDQLRLQSVETWFDPMEMFRQMAPNGITNRQLDTQKTSPPLDENVSGVISRSSCPVTGHSSLSWANGHSAQAVTAGCPVLQASADRVSPGHVDGTAMEQPKVTSSTATQPDVAQVKGAAPVLPEETWTSVEPPRVAPTTGEAAGRAKVQAMTATQAATRAIVETAEPPVARLPVVAPELEPEPHQPDALEPHRDESKDALTITTRAALVLPQATPAAEPELSAVVRAAEEAPTLRSGKVGATVAATAEVQDGPVDSTAGNGLEDILVLQHTIKTRDNVIDLPRENNDKHLAQPADRISPPRRDGEDCVRLVAGEGVGAPSSSEEAKAVGEKMSTIATE